MERQTWKDHGKGWGGILARRASRRYVDEELGWEIPSHEGIWGSAGDLREGEKSKKWYRASSPTNQSWKGVKSTTCVQENKVGQACHRSAQYKEGVLGIHGVQSTLIFHCHREEGDHGVGSAPI